MNPTVKSLHGVQKQWALAMHKLDFSELDAADSHLLNRVIWYSTKGFNKPYPGDDRVLHPDEVHSYLKAKGEREDDDDDDD